MREKEKTWVFTTASPMNYQAGEADLYHAPQLIYADEVLLKERLKKCKLDLQFLVVANCIVILFYFFL